MFNSKFNILNRLHDEASKSLLEHQMAAAILKGNKMINKPCCNLNRNSCRGSQIASLHAEARVILNHYGKALFFNSKGHFYLANIKPNTFLDLIVIKINKFGDTLNARPCYYCLDMMKAVGIKKVFYTVSPNKLICENVKDMISIQISGVTKQLKKINQDNNDKFFEDLLKKVFPNFIRYDSLLYFINYNLINILPHFKVDIIKDIVIINNKKDLTIIKANIIL